MTIKQIADFTGRSKKTVCNWCEKITHVTCEKITQAKISNIPADFTLDESLAIMKAGKVSEALISILIENTERNNKQNDYVTKADLKEFAKDIVKEIMKEVLPLITKPEVKQIERKEYKISELPKKYSSVAEAAINNKIKSEEKKKRIEEGSYLLFKIT